MALIQWNDGASGRLLGEKLVAAGWDGVPDVSWGVTRMGWPGLNFGPRMDGLEQLRVFHEMGGLCPAFTDTLAVAQYWVKCGELVFGREREHSQGRDIVGPGHRRWKEKEYWTIVVKDVVDEWRVHVFEGKIIARGRKVQVEPPWRKMPVRNRGNGWVMEHRSVKPPGLGRFAKWMVAAVGYDFGAADVLVTRGPEELVYWALEVNRAPGLDEYTAAAYAKAIGRVGKGKRNV